MGVDLNGGRVDRMKVPVLFSSGGPVVAAVGSSAVRASSESCKACRRVARVLLNVIELYKLVLCALYWQR